MKRQLVLIVLSLSVVLVFIFQNCAPTKVGFAKTLDSSGQSSGLSINPAETNPVDSSISGDNTTVTDVPVNNTADLPKFKLFIEACQAGDICKVQVVLDRIAAADFSFDWKTNDSAYLKDSLKYAKPNFHYEPTQGKILIKKGDTKSAMLIKSIRWSFSGTSDSTLIALNLMNCVYDLKSYSCQSFMATD